jgi:hypothetical protein
MKGVIREGCMADTVQTLLTDNAEEMQPNIDVKGIYTLSLALFLKVFKEIDKYICVHNLLNCLSHFHTAAVLMFWLFDNITAVQRIIQQQQSRRPASNQRAPDQAAGVSTFSRHAHA